jgi:allophanate hydrolase
MTVASLRARYRAGTLTPAQVIETIAARTAGDDPHRVWIRPLTRDEMMRYVNALADKDPASLPLYGIPFAIKDNIDLAGVPTTAGCPAYAYTPQKNAAVVERLIAAGAIPVGKTNLDQFATGLSGQRSPHGACRNALDARYASGGSSSGSAVAVALGLAAFSLGTDTAGSGRVPAAFHGLVGLKPTKGVLSTLGVVPACKSLDCVSIFAHSAHRGRRSVCACVGAVVVIAGFAFGAADDRATRAHADAARQALRCAARGATRILRRYVVCARVRIGPVALARCRCAADRDRLRAVSRRRASALRRTVRR